MRHDALRRAIGAGMVIAAAALLFGNHIVGLTGATFNASATNAGSAFAGGWIGKPTSPTATASGYDVKLTWTPGTAGPVTGQTIKGTDNGTSSNCSGAAYTDFSYTVTAAAASSTDSNRATTAPVGNGDWVCYEVVSTSATVWTQATPLSALQVGLAATGVAISNGGTSGSIDQNDTITVTFNQAVAASSVPTTVKVCVFPNTIVIGDPSSGSKCNSASDVPSIGTLTTTTALANSRFTGSTASVSGSTVTIKLSTGGAVSASGASWTFTPATTILSSATVDQASACTSGSNCQPTTSSNF